MSSMSQFLPLPALLRLLRQHEVDDRYRKRVRSQMIFSAALEPLRWWERLRWGGRIRRTEIEHPPVYLLGYGRSGTTHLHYLLWQDPRFGVVSNYLANMYPIALTGQGWLDSYFANKIPSKRPMDNVAITLDAPQEEEIALLNATDQAPLHFMSFPRALPEIYDRYVADLGSDAGVLAAWKRTYLEMLKKATIPVRERAGQPRGHRWRWRRGSGGRDAGLGQGGTQHRRGLGALPEQRRYGP